MQKPDMKNFPKTFLKTSKTSNIYVTKRENKDTNVTRDDDGSHDLSQDRIPRPRHDGPRHGLGPFKQF